jgi:hypothetical protein
MTVSAGAAHFGSVETEGVFEPFSTGIPAKARAFIANLIAILVGFPSHYVVRRHLAFGHPDRTSIRTGIRISSTMPNFYERVKLSF